MRQEFDWVDKIAVEPTTMTLATLFRLPVRGETQEETLARFPGINVVGEPKRTFSTFAKGC